MELKTFIAEALNEIVGGITTAQQDLKEQGAIVNPPTIAESRGLYYTVKDPRQKEQKTVQMVEFDILLGQSEGAESKAGIGVFLASVGIGAQGKTETDKSALNKIRFSVPVVFPSGE